MKFDDTISKLQLSKKELNDMQCVISQFSQEMHWEYDKAKNKDDFEKEFSKSYGFLLAEIDYIMCELWSLSDSFSNLYCVYIAFCSAILPNKPKIIYTVLSECSKNYEDYEISTIAGVSKEDLDNLLKEFKEKVIDKLEYLKDI